MAKKPNILSEDFIEYLIIRLKEVFPTKDDLKEELDDKTKGLPTKDEFYSENDKLMKEIKTSREEQTVLTHQTKRNTKRIEKLETRTFKH